MKLTARALGTGCVVLPAIMAIVAMWWGSQTEGAFMEGCGHQSDTLNLVGSIILVGSMVTLTMSTACVRWIDRKRGWFGFVCSALLLVAMVICKETSHWVC